MGLGVEFGLHTIPYLFLVFFSSIYSYISYVRGRGDRASFISVVGKRLVFFSQLWFLQIPN